MTGEQEAPAPEGSAADDTTTHGRIRDGLRRAWQGRARLHAAGLLAASLAALTLPLISPGRPAAANDPSPGRPAAANDPLSATLCFGAAAMDPGNTCEQVTDGPTFPAPEDARDDRAPSYQQDCQVQPEFTDRWTCEFGDVAASRNVALVGNSHAVQWLPALHEVGLRQGFKVTTYISAMCFATTTRIAWRTEELRDNCHDWGHWVRESIAEGDYDLVVQTERTYRWPAEKYVGHADDTFERGYREHLERWAEAGKTVLVIRDTPMPESNVPTCLMRNPTKHAACTTSSAEALQRDPLVVAAESFLSPRMRVADLTRYFCRSDECPSVIGRVIVFFDASHVTATYSRSLAPYLEDHVANALRVDAAARAGAPG